MSKAYRVFHLKNSITMESINVVVVDAGTSDYFSDDEDGMTFSPYSEQVMNKGMDNQFEPEYENDKRKENSASEEHVDPKASSSEHIVPDIIR